MADTYKPASLETACCLWEEVLEHLRNPKSPKHELVEDARARMGTPHLRLVVIAWTDAADEDWAKVKEKNWDKPFDWEWIPAWIEKNVDWTTRQPTLRSPRLVPGENA
jgi:hypothetical protein